jgi:hypothetical protein
MSRHSVSQDEERPTVVGKQEATDVTMVEHNDTKHEQGQPLSAYAAWTRSQCIRKFWRLYGTGVGVSLCGM